MLSLPTLTQRCPALYRTLKASLAEKSIMGGGGEFREGEKGEIFSLPFDEGRDSRHNYKSGEAHKLYTNREESRDEFLKLLQKFQDLKTKFDSNSFQYFKHELKRDGGTLLYGLKGFDNVVWFADFFVDTLLQIGIGGEKEMDNEVLSLLENTADASKVHKLHRRFSDVSNSTSKRNPAKPQEKKKGAVSRIEQQFRGNLEFFFLFINLTDSANFNQLLSTRLSHELTLLLGNTKLGVEKRIKRSKLAGKFLGLLFFGVHQSKQGIKSATDWGNSVQPVVDLVGLLREAWSLNYLILTVPWLVEVLKMLQYDALMKESLYYKGLLATLQTIKHSLDPGTCTHLFVVAELEGLFIELGIGGEMPSPGAHIGVVLPEQNSVGSVKDKNVGLDNISINFGKKFLTGCINSWKEFSGLLDDLGGPLRGGGRKMSTSRKVRPHSLSLIGPANPSPSPSTPTVVVSPLKGCGGGGGGGGGASKFQSSLVDLFFHQHQELQSVCEFVVDRVVRHVCSVVVDTCIKPTVDECVAVWKEEGNKDLTKINPPSSSFDLSEYMKILEQIGGKSCTAADVVLKHECSSRVEKGLVLLAPRGDERVLEIATELSGKHAISEGAKLVRGIVRTEAKKCLDKKVAEGVKEEKVPRAQADEGGDVEGVLGWIRGFGDGGGGDEAFDLEDLRKLGLEEKREVNASLNLLFGQRRGFAGGGEWWRVLEIGEAVVPEVGVDVDCSWVDDLVMNGAKLRGLVEGLGGGRRLGRWLRAAVPTRGGVVWAGCRTCEDFLIGMLPEHREVAAGLVEGDEGGGEEGKVNLSLDEFLFWRLRMKI